MLHESVVVGPFRCNCHILADESTGEAVIVDPGDEPDAILEKVRDLKVLKVKALLHTHGHLDHINGTRRLREETGAKIMIHAADRPLYERLAEQFAFFGIDVGSDNDPLPVDEFLEDGQEVTFGRHGLKVIHTPGHTPGSCCFHKEGLLFAGDTLFRRSIGRTDLPGGNLEQETASIRSRLYGLDPETVVFPGHGSETRIREEKAENPFVSGD